MFAVTAVSFFRRGDVTLSLSLSVSLSLLLFVYKKKQASQPRRVAGVERNRDVTLNIRGARTGGRRMAFESEFERRKEKMDAFCPRL